jgi:hypothetical protein
VGVGLSRWMTLTVFLPFLVWSGRSVPGRVVVPVGVLGSGHGVAELRWFPDLAVAPTE